MGDQSKLAKAYMRHQRAKGIIAAAFIGLLLLGAVGYAITNLLSAAADSVFAIISPELIGAAILGGAIVYLLES